LKAWESLYICDVKNQDRMKKRAAIAKWIYPF